MRNETGKVVARDRLSSSALKYGVNGKWPRSGRVKRAFDGGFEAVELNWFDEMLGKAGL